MILENSNSNCGGQGQEVSQENNVSNWTRACSCDIRKRMWLLYSFVLRVCPRLNWKVIDYIFWWRRPFFPQSLGLTPSPRSDLSHVTIRTEQWPQYVTSKAGGLALQHPSTLLCCLWKLEAVPSRNLGRFTKVFWKSSQKIARQRLPRHTLLCTALPRPHSPLHCSSVAHHRPCCALWKPWSSVKSIVGSTFDPL